MAELQDTLILCSTARLARSVSLAHARRQRAQGMMQWQPLPVLTLNIWLAKVIEQALLQGQIALEEVPRMVLNSAQERVLWERVIERTLTGDTAVLFDRVGLAQAAQDANRLIQEWNIAIASAWADNAYTHLPQSEETTQFLQWRNEFRKQCKTAGWMEPTRYVDWQIAQIAKGAVELPPHISIAGYDRISPQEQRLLDTLTERGVVVAQWSHLLSEAPTNVSKTGLADSEAECRAAVAWVADKLAANPAARIGIAVPELANLRGCLIALLDDTLHPQTLSPAYAEQERLYDLSLGLALSRNPLVAVALDLLRLASRQYQINQQDFSNMLLGPYWSASINEADTRALLDVRIRAHLPLNLTLQRLATFIARQQERGLRLPRLSADLQAMQQALQQLPLRQLPSLWAQSLQQLLKSANWPGERSLSSHEYQAGRAFDQALATLADFDALSGPVTLPQAVQRLNRLCTDQVFQPESGDDPQVLVMGMLETVAEPLDAMWVMGMNDHVWPPAANPNPLLPASLQRAVRAPNADGPVQAEFAGRVHRRLLKSAHELIFSWAHKSGESELRVSPLLQDIPPDTNALTLASTIAERFAQTAIPDNKHWLDDHKAPPVSAGEKVRGGAGLIRAQAICPAWAYYRYRLGARRLDDPTEGLDAMDRGNLVHAVLQSFWQGRDSEYLQALDDQAFTKAILSAVEQGVARFSESLEEPLPPNFLMLEKQRLQALLKVWLVFEKTRPAFSVEQCEQDVSLDIAGMTVKLTLDRVDRLADGKLVVIDYKTGSAISHSSWAESRITEPQLPIYASLALAGEQIVAVCFAQVRADEQRFIGVSDDAEVLPGIKSLDEADKLFPPETFPTWDALIAHWKISILDLAGELIAGGAAVVFENENALINCEVLPLLRLPERYLQIEASQSSQ
ncbi:MAG: PD-(D/E)XK nuclease family protein [Methylophilaceae bacterium]|nr:PD-(D/E)XK nuclease family protein [Methylotenera sp.]